MTTTTKQSSAGCGKEARIVSGTMDEAAQIISGRTAKKETGMPGRETTKKEPEAGALGGQRSVVFPPMSEQLREVLLHVQTMRMYDKGKPKESNWVLVSEDRDWLVVYLWAQYHGLFKSNPERPAFSAFVEWINEANVVLRTTVCNVDCLSRTNRKLAGKRSPWEEIPKMSPNLLMRWRVLWRALNRTYGFRDGSDSGEMSSTTQA